MTWGWSSWNQNQKKNVLRGYRRLSFRHIRLRDCSWLLKLAQSWNVDFPLAVKCEDNTNIVNMTFRRLCSIWAIYLGCKWEFTFLDTKTSGFSAGSPQDTVDCYFTADLWVDKLQTGGNIISELPLCGLFIQLSQTSASSVLWNALKLSKRARH